MASDVAPLLLRARELFPDAEAVAEAEAKTKATTNAAVLLRTRQSNRVCLGLFSQDTEEPELLELVPETETREQAAEQHWALTWSPDDKLLVVCGHVEGDDGALEGVLWVVTRPQWLDEEETEGSTLLLRVDMKKHLPQKQWTPTIPIAGVFYPSPSSSEFIVVSGDGVTAQLAKVELTTIHSVSGDTELDDLDQRGDSDGLSVIVVPVVPGNSLDDVTDEVKICGDNVSCSDLYGEWFIKRMLGMDERFGQLHSAYELGRLATMCLSGSSSAFEDFFLHTERLYKCVYELRLATCCLLPLREWATLPLHEQAKLVVTSESTNTMTAVSADIWMKGAYSALYCMNYDVAYDLTMRVINGISSDSGRAVASHGTSGSGQELTHVHLLSLVLDLVSASSFRYWGKKRTLCCALLSSSSLASTDLFSHQVTDLLLPWIEKIEAIQALMVELGLSDDDLEMRRLAGEKQNGSGVEAVLLNELKVVVDLLHEEQNDRQFLLRLLQRGFQLVQLTYNSADSDAHGNTSDTESIFLQQMVQLCVKEAMELVHTPSKAASVSGDWNQYLEVGLSYLELWGDFCPDDGIFEEFCVNEVLPAISSSQKDSNDGAVCPSEDIVRRFHQFFSLQADQATVSSERSQMFLQLAQQCQAATKFGVDDYESVLVYIKHTLLSPEDSNPLARHDQLERAFRTGQVDVLEKALQRPFSFGKFLLEAATPTEKSIYESLHGTDHVGILLVLRMVLECSKRIYQQQSTEEKPANEHSLFPLSKPSTDRITMLFMCLKKLKDIADSLDGDVGQLVDLKRVGAAVTTTELLTPLHASHGDPNVATVRRQAAVEAVRPLLSGQTVKLVTKILRKLHNVTPSAMVMIYINDLLAGIWREHGAAGSSTAVLSADLGAYAYESCVPCLSVLTNEHLLLFYRLFLHSSNAKPSPDLIAHLDLSEEFYGQQLTGFKHFGSLLSAQKRVEITADTLKLFQTKYNSWQTSGSRSNVSSASSTSSSSSVSWDPTQFKRKEQELLYLERELAGNVCYLLLSDIQQCGLTFDSSESHSLDDVRDALTTWFDMDAVQQASNEEGILHKRVLIEVCQNVTSVDLATLIMEIVLRIGGDEVVKDTIAQSYQSAVTNLIDQCFRDTAEWVDNLVWTWVTGSAKTPDTRGRGRLDALERYLRTTTSNTDGLAAYERVLTLIAQSPSSVLREIASFRLEKLQTSGSVRIGAGQVQQAVLLKCDEYILHLDNIHEWTKAAVLNNVLATSHNDSSEVARGKLTFGLQLKAVWSVLLTKHRLERREGIPPILEASSQDIFDQFDALFEEMLVFVEHQAADDSLEASQFAELATVALSNLLVRYDGANFEPRAERNDIAWQEEQTRALQARIKSQFGVGAEMESEKSPLRDGNVSCWSALFLRGYWGEDLLKWYSNHAYSKLSGDAAVTEAVVLAHWEAHNLDLACQLLLMCPFDLLREKYAAQLFASVLYLPVGSSSWCMVMELLLLRFDVMALLHHGLYASLVKFLLHTASTKSSLCWTSKGDYVVCALVVQGEFAVAGRLTCALRRTHPLLWDVETARLLVASYLKSLAKASTKTQDANLRQLQREVHAQASRHFDRAVLS